jgi:hypothetical protein
MQGWLCKRCRRARRRPGECDYVQRAAGADHVIVVTDHVSRQRKQIAGSQASFSEKLHRIQGDARNPLVELWLVTKSIF